MPTELLPSGRVAVAAVDPGGTSGVFCGCVALDSTMKGTVKTLSRVKRGEIDGPFYEQGFAIASVLEEWFANSTFDYVRVDQQWIVIEDFVLRRRVEGGATGNLTAVWVAAALHGILAAEPACPVTVEYQQPSDAKRFATNARLKMWKLWRPTVGQPHARDAARHWAVKVNSLVK